jgi:hypothetical protein
VCADADPQALDSAIGTRLGTGLAVYITTGEMVAGRVDPHASPPRPAMLQIRLDGKTVRGAKDADGNQQHLMAALAGRSEPDATTAVLAQAKVSGAKTDEPATARRPSGHTEAARHRSDGPMCRTR